jgi:hypothetical protein
LSFRRTVEHGERVKEIAARIESLSYIEAALVETNGGEHDVASPPWCVLGVKLAEPAEGDAAA